jgi:hypothetical protein
MKHETTIKLTFDSGYDAKWIENQIDPLFNCETVRDTITDALKLDHEPQLVGVVAMPAVVE